MKNLFIGIRIFVVLSVLTGVAYPLLITGIGQGLFSRQAGGSLIYQDNILVGSDLLAQKFQKKSYFWPRPSAADYNGSSSAASNQSVGNEALLKAVAERKTQGLTRDLLYASGSGLDPHISPAAANDQVERIVGERKLNLEQRDLVLKLVRDYTEARQWGFLGEPRVNVLKLNLALDTTLGKVL
ncbi:potassium-transporting ATPase subunit KdpC [Bdellovibrio svalbardensis]|uniref:Potassium-transporting ATPase KdpC subunit n=1 Tax=Bdellovibrio svalbardensis TaxID=2972972 RepID=A0ABT6DN32_9BACT|nr:potassium-transporting ATPase subunit KdpC [Bdellovibrio svalbardensis]MDG0818290.1 potassium-transporting ATPase subunit KdpC [Bdellovibrio svalbardensis]